MHERWGALRVLLGAFGAVLLVAAVRGIGVPAATAEPSGAPLDGERHGDSTRVYTEVPPPTNVYDGAGGVSFYGKSRIEIPGAVAVNKPPYVCDLDRGEFDAKEAFVAHLQTAHGSQLEEGARSFVVHEGQVHFVGR